MGHVGVDVPVSGCAVEYFKLLDGGEELAAWLLSVKSRLEAVGDSDGIAQSPQPEAQ